MKKDLIICFFIFLLSAFLLKDLLKPNFYTSHDGPHQIVRLYYWDKAIQNLHIPPRWAGGLLNGYGYPLFIFSYHMPWIIAEPFVLSGFSIIDSIKITFFLGYFLSGITMYLFQKRLYGRFAATVGTAIYLLAPYRFSNIFVRASIGDATTFIFIPLLFLAIHESNKTQNVRGKYIALGALALAGILLSHAMVFFFITLSLVLYGIFILTTKHYLRREKLTSLISICILGLLISSYYLIPSFIERNYTKFSEIFRSAFSGNKFLSLSQLFYSPWGYGTVDAKEGGMSLQLGFAQWTAAIGALFVWIFYKFLNRTKDKANTDVIYYLLLFIFSLLLMLEISNPFWQILNKIAIVDFTWRILPLTVFSASVLAGFMVHKGKLRYILGISLILLALYANRNHTRINQSLDWSIPFYLKLEKTTNSFDEYTPKWVNSKTTEKRNQDIDFIKGSGDVGLLKKTTNKNVYEISSSNDIKIRLNTIYYPGWTVELDKNKIDVLPDSEGLMTLSIKKGKHFLNLEFTETPLRKLSNLITLGSLIFVGFIFFKKRKV